MKKLSLIIGKRQIIIVALLVTLSTAAFLNYQFATGDQAITVENTESKENSKSDGAQNYGEPQLVYKTNDNKNNDNSFFETAKINKKMNEDKTIESCLNIINSKETSDEQKERAEKKTYEVNDISTKQTKIEDWLHNKGFKQCTAYIDKEKNTARVMVDANNLDEKKVAQIKSAVQDVTKFSAENITVSPAKDVKKANDELKDTENTPRDDEQEIIN